MQDFAFTLDALEDDLFLQRLMEDGDDRLIIEGGPFDAPRPMLAPNTLLAKKRSLYLPLRRQLKVGRSGDDVLAVKRAYAHDRAHLLQWPIKTKKYTSFTKLTTKQFQGKVHLHRDGVYGLQTHKKLAGRGSFDQYGAYLLQHYHPAPMVSEVRRRIAATAMFAHAHAPRHYTQDMVLRFEGVNKRIRPPHMWNYADCSAFATWCFWVAGAEDPNKWGYNGFGSTYTMEPNGRVVARHQLQPGDLIFYVGHVAVYVGNDMVVSHGHEGGPFFVPMSYRTDYTSFRSYFAA